MPSRRAARRRHLRILPTVVLTVLILMVPTVVYAWGRSSPAFQIERVSVSGVEAVSSKRALQRLRAAFLGRNLFTVTSRDVAAVLDEECFVAAVHVDRDFPDTLRVRLTEHRPVLVAMAGARWYLVADTGYVVCPVTAPAAKPSPVPSPTDGGAPTPTPTSSLPSTSPSASGTSSTDEAVAGGAPALSGDAARLPRIRATGSLKAGEVTRDRAVRAALLVLRGTPRWFRSSVHEVRAGRTGQVTCTMRDGMEVRLGLADERLTAKALALRAVLTAYAAEEVVPTWVDVSVPERPLGRPLLK